MFILLFSFLLAVALVIGAFWVFNWPITSDGIKARTWLKGYMDKFNAWRQ